MLQYFRKVFRRIVLKITNGLFEQHFHGCFGIDFNKASIDDVIFLAREMFKRGITTIIPTIATEELPKMKEQINIIQNACTKLTCDCANIFGIHLEGPFLNPQKKGAHPENLLKNPNIEDYQKYLDHPLIKIVTIAPELDKDFKLCNYLKQKGIKISAGHCLCNDLTYVNQVTHLFNAMDGLHHRNKTTSLCALFNEDIFTELIADGEHVQNDMLKLVFKVKDKNKILLISDCAPPSKSNIKEFEFLGEIIYKQGEKLVGKNGTIAGSAMLLDDIVKRLVKENILSFDDAIKMASSNQHNYHNCQINAQVEWNDDLTIKTVRSI